MTLSQVSVSRSGFDDDVQAAVLDLARLDSVSPADAAAAVRSALADACDRELAAARTTLDEDRRLLLELRAEHNLALKPLPPPPPPSPPEIANVPLDSLSDGVQTAEVNINETDLMMEESIRLEAEAAKEAELKLHRQWIIDTFPRRETILMFRIEKKSILNDCSRHLRSSK